MLPGRPGNAPAGRRSSRHGPEAPPTLSSAAGRSRRRELEVLRIHVTVRTWAAIAAEAREGSVVKVGLASTQRGVNRSAVVRRKRRSVASAAATTCRDDDADEQHERGEHQALAVVS